MKKILVFGDLNDVLQSIADSLEEEFIVQIASDDPKNVKNMIKMTKPDLVLFCQVGVDNDIAMLDALSENLYKANLPVLGVATVEGKAHFETYKAQIAGLDYVTRPITKFGLIKKCKQMLELEEEDPKKPVNNISPQEKPLILIVDDTALTLRRLERMLAKRYRTLTASDGKEALEIIQGKKPDLVLLDYYMPGWDGPTTYDNIKKEPGGEMIPVIFLTGVSEREQIYKALERYPAGYVLKPPIPEELFQKIDEALLSGNQ